MADDEFDIYNVGLDGVMEILPHRPPFLFVDKVEEFVIDKKIVAVRELQADEPHFVGHFPGRPIMPGVLITEAMAQAAGLFLALSGYTHGEPLRGRMFYLARSDNKWTASVGPGETLIVEAKPNRSLGHLTVFNVRARTKSKQVAIGTLTLSEVVK